MCPHKARPTPGLPPSTRSPLPDACSRACPCPDNTDCCRHRSQNTVVRLQPLYVAQVLRTSGELAMHQLTMHTPPDSAVSGQARAAVNTGEGSTLVLGSGPHGGQPLPEPMIPSGHGNLAKFLIS